jgi:hypothetical protein
MSLRQRLPREKNEQHLEFIRSLQCVRCGDDTATEAAHIRTGALEYGKRPTGMSEKPSDKFTVPLCGKCHRLQHSLDEMEFWKCAQINPFVLALCLHAASGDHELAQAVIRSHAMRTVEKWNV